MSGGSVCSLNRTGRDQLGRTSSAEPRAIDLPRSVTALASKRLRVIAEHLAITA